MKYIMINDNNRQISDYPDASLFRTIGILNKSVRITEASAVYRISKVVIIFINKE